MARSFRESRFGRRSNLSEDINPSAYIVNLADCMLVLACGFMVALVTAWNIDLGGVTELEKENLQEVQPEEMNKDDLASGNYYIEAGKVYRDPNTGQLYMVTETGEKESVQDSGSSTNSTTGASNTGSGQN